ncbi:hypothetical protein VIBNISO65_1130002 [Vibrio nigripulchritudo SO65]|nr:hypothetical protein VIBNIAM115_290046 [Vibrio nigripulchritudo AM115]CCN39602.1 hypothetical protein VIBNIFTn2_1080001 [Vibrio nigripulchritudo FTn2]CCN63570.1 hypothetical protein VIBNIPon4_130167 [Vibrio nigripulchritudo POn4]CCN74704.1 hypothetical protein VIBNISO65_1130002 [Vibrio nigripulchritudo SO65]
MGQKISSRRASLFGFHAALSIIDLEPLDLPIDVLPESQTILAEPTILGWFEYKIIFGLNSTRYVLSHDPDSNLIHLGIRNKRDI